MDLDTYGTPLVVALAAVVLTWYFVGSIVNRRRVAAAARWVHRGLLAVRGSADGESRATIKWLSTNSFNIGVEPAKAPFQAVLATVLLQSREMISVWLMDRLTGRRDLLLVRCDLRQQPIWGLEIFRPRSVLSGDLRRYATRQGWPIEAAADGLLRVAHGGGKAGELCSELLDALGDARHRLVRLGVRRQAPHVAVALDLPDPGTADPMETVELLERLASIILRYCTPTGPLARDVSA